MRVGIGYDIHRLVTTNEESFILVGGVKLACHKRVEAHSDGDVLSHAITDACLGALSLGDIGQWYSDKDSANKGRSSCEFVKEVVGEIHRLGWEVYQVDSVVVLEGPPVAPHVEAIRSNLAQWLQLELSSVSVKAKTAEGLGPVGERRAIEAQAVVTIRERHSSNAN